MRSYAISASSVRPAVACGTAPAPVAAVPGERRALTCVALAELIMLECLARPHIVRTAHVPTVNMDYTVQCKRRHDSQADASAPAASHATRVQSTTMVVAQQQMEVSGHTGYLTFATYESSDVALAASCADDDDGA